MILAVDACAMIAYLRDEDGAEAVEKALASDDDTCFAHAVNLCEVYYDFIRAADEPTAQDALMDLYAAGLALRDDIDPDYWQAVGRLKADGRTSLADCFCIALAQRLGGQVMTSDHREFDALAAAGTVAVKFIR